MFEFLHKHCNLRIKDLETQLDAVHDTSLKYLHELKRAQGLIKNEDYFIKESQQLTERIADLKRENDRFRQIIKDKIHPRFFDNPKRGPGRPKKTLIIKEAK